MRKNFVKLRKKPRFPPLMGFSSVMNDGNSPTSHCGICLRNFKLETVNFNP